MIWIVLGCCWVSQIRTKPTKNIWGPLLDSISSYYVQCPWKIVSFFQVFRHLNYHILVFFPAYIGLYWTPAGWYGQKPYLGPAHMWLRQNMAVCDAELGPKWGGVTNTRFTFLASYEPFGPTRPIDNTRVLRPLHIAAKMNTRLAVEDESLESMRN